MGTANTEAMNEHLKTIRAQVASGEHAVVICDGAGWHAKSKEIVVPSSITLVTLPPSSPELDPMENVLQFLRANRFAAQVWKAYRARRSRLLRRMELVRGRRSAYRIYRNP
jgi:putative transposase